MKFEAHGMVSWRWLNLLILEFYVQTFDGKWVHIEDENYRVLADAIFQQQESAVRWFFVLVVLGHFRVQCGCF